MIGKLPPAVTSCDRWGTDHCSNTQVFVCMSQRCDVFRCVCFTNLFQEQSGTSQFFQKLLPLLPVGGVNACTLLLLWVQRLLPHQHEICPIETQHSNHHSYDVITAIPSAIGWSSVMSQEVLSISMNVFGWSFWSGSSWLTEDETEQKVSCCHYPRGWM